MPLLAPSTDLVDLPHSNGSITEPHHTLPGTEQTRPRLVVGHMLRSKLNSYQPSSLQAVGQRDINKPGVTTTYGSSNNRTGQDALVRSSRPAVNNGINKPLPPPPTTTTAMITSINPKRPTPAAQKPTLRSRFNTGSPSPGPFPEPEKPNIRGFVSQHAASDHSLTALTPSPSPPLPSQDSNKKTSQNYRPTAGDQWPFLDIDMVPSSRRPQRKSGVVEDHQQAPISTTEHHDDDIEQEEMEQQQLATDEEDQGEEKRPSDYELFVRRALEEDRHYRTQIMRLLSRRSSSRRRDEARKIEQHYPKQQHRDPGGARGFSWQRAAAARRQQEEEEMKKDVRRSWGGSGGEKVPNTTTNARKRHSDGGILRRKASMSSLSSIRKAIANYIKPPRL